MPPCRFAPRPQEDDARGWAQPAPRRPLRVLADLPGYRKDVLAARRVDRQDRPATVAAERLAAGEHAAGMAAGGLKLLNGTLALLGGPVGIAVMGAVLLAEKFFNVKHAADEANLAIVQLWRAQDAQARSKPAEARDIFSVDANLEKSKQERDALLAGNASKQDIAYAQAKVDTWQKNADKLP